MKSSTTTPKFWMMDPAKVTSELRAKVDTIEDLQQYSTPFTYGTPGETPLIHSDPLDRVSEFLCAIVLLILPGCFLWLIPIAFYLPYVIWTFSVPGIVQLCIGFGLVHLILYTWFIQYPGYFVPKIFSYFSMRVVWEDGYAPATHSILVAPAHGVFPYGSLLIVVLYKMFIKNPIRGVAASVIFYLPVSRHFMQWLGVVPATREIITTLLESGKPVAVPSGGIAEIFRTARRHQTIVLRDRKGLARIALKTGAQLAPCYTFGTTELYTMHGSENELLQYVSRTLRMGVLFFTGRWYLPIAFRTPLVSVFSRPIDVEKVENPTVEQVDELHARLLDRIKELYYTHREAYGWGHRELVIE